MNCTHSGCKAKFRSRNPIWDEEDTRRIIAAGWRVYRSWATGLGDPTLRDGEALCPAHVNQPTYPRGARAMKTPHVTTTDPVGETYEEFTARVAADSARVKAKCAALDQFIPVCTSCGETCDQADSGTTCKINGARMLSRWARETAEREFYRLGNFGGSWWNEVARLAVLLDRTRAEHVALRDAEHAACYAKRTELARAFLRDQLEACSGSADGEPCEICARARAALESLEGR